MSVPDGDTVDYCTECGETLDINMHREDEWSIMFQCLTCGATWSDYCPLDRVADVPGEMERALTEDDYL